MRHAETDETHTGMLLGVLPKSRCFEARIADGQIVEGKVDRAVLDIDAFKQRWQGREASLAFRVVRVSTLSRYILTGAERA